MKYKYLPKYRDKWDELWVRISWYVVRLSDNNIGGWFNGDGLERV